MREALEILCGAYWQPLYCVARGRGFSEADAKDAVQGFFECLLRRETFGTAEESAGRLRSFLLGAFGHYCVQQWRRSQTQKRGGAREHLPLDDYLSSAQPEQHFQRVAGQQLTPETMYKREWATTVLERSLAALKAEYTARGWAERFEALSGPLLQNSETTLETPAERLGVTAGVLRVYLHRMRGHYRQQDRARTRARPSIAVNRQTHSTGAAGAVRGLRVMPESCRNDSRKCGPAARRDARAIQARPPGRRRRVEEAARLFPQYEVLGLLGRGGMGAVYQARQVALDRCVAIKLLPLEVSADQEFAERFRREARAMAKLSHPHIVHVYEFGTTSAGHLFFVMEFIEGANLADLVHRSALPRGAGAGVGEPGLPRARLCPRQGDHPLRHQAGQRDGEPGGDREGGGLRRRAPRRGRQSGGLHHDQRGDGDAGLHGARAEARPGGGPARGHLLRRRDALRDALRRDAAGRLRAAEPSAPAATRGSIRSCSRRCSPTRRSDIKPRTSCGAISRPRSPRRWRSRCRPPSRHADPAARKKSRLLRYAGFTGFIAALAGGASLLHQPKPPTTSAPAPASSPARPLPGAMPAAGQTHRGRWEPSAGGWKPLYSEAEWKTTVPGKREIENGWLHLQDYGLGKQQPSADGAIRALLRYQARPAGRESGAVELRKLSRGAGLFPPALSGSDRAFRGHWKSFEQLCPAAPAPSRRDHPTRAARGGRSSGRAG